MSGDTEPIRRGVAIGVDVLLLAAISLIAAFLVVLGSLGMLVSTISLDSFFKSFVFGLVVYVLGSVAVVVRWNSWTTIERRLSMLVLVPAVLFLCYIAALLWLIMYTSL